MLCMPRNLHFEAVPATNSVTATKAAIEVHKVLSANEPHVEKLRFTALVTTSGRTDDHHHVQSAPTSK